MPDFYYRLTDLPPLIACLLLLCWSSITGFWIYHARRAKAHKFIEPHPKQLLCYWLPFFSAAALLAPCPWLANSVIGHYLFSPSAVSYAFGVGCAAAGVALGIWARIVLAGNWSGNVTLKHDHQLVTAGPYRLVRHPIYSAFLLLFLGTAICLAQWRGVLAVALVFGSFYYKWRSEEYLMTSEFGEQYQRYREKTGAIFPRRF